MALGWKNFFKTEFDSTAALRSPPHITLHMPFEWRANKEEVLLTELKQFAEHQKPVNIQLKNFDCFAPRVIYMRVNENTELQNLQSSLAQFCKADLNLFNANRQDQPFRPHLTVAFRDLKKSDFHKAWNLIKEQEFKYDFTCQNLVLLKHNGKQWEVRMTFPFGDESFR